MSDVLLDTPAKILSRLQTMRDTLAKFVQKHPESRGVPINTPEATIAFLRGQYGDAYPLPDLESVWRAAHALNLGGLPAWQGEPDNCPKAFEALDSLAEWCRSKLCPECGLPYEGAPGREACPQCHMAKDQTPPADFFEGRIDTLWHLWRDVLSAIAPEELGRHYGPDYWQIRALLQDDKRALDAITLQEIHGKIMASGVERDKAWKTSLTEVVEILKRDAQATASAVGLLAVDDEDVGILRALAETAPRLQTQDEIQGESRVSRRTISNRIPSLLAAGLVAQPKGTKSGTTISDKGLVLLKQIDGAKRAQ